MTKHYGIHNVSHKRLILLCLENPEKKGTTIAVDYDALDAETRSELIQIIDGPEAQAVKDAYVVLKKKVFQEHPSSTALKYLMSGGFAKEYNVKDITLFIEPNRTVALEEMIRQVEGFEEAQRSKAKDNPFFGNQPSNPNATSISQELSSVAAEPVAPTPVQQPVSEQPLVNPNVAIMDVLSSLTNTLVAMNEKLDKLSAPQETKEKPKATKKKK